MLLLHTFAYPTQPSNLIFQNSSFFQNSYKMPRNELAISERVWLCEEFMKLGNAFAVLRRWPFRSKKPDPKTVRNIVKKFRETGSVLNKKPPGRRRSILVEQNFNQVGVKVEADPMKSTRQLSLELEMSQSSVCRILKEMDMKPYHPTFCQELLPGDPDQR